MCMTLLGILAVATFAAQESDDVEIISNNVYYGETLRLMYAVKAPDGADISVSARDSAGNSVEVVPYYVNGTNYMQIKGEMCYVYVTKGGVAAQSIDEVITFTARLGNASDTQSYSVLEYLYERLYVSVGVTEGQRKMYNELLEYADAADRILNESAEGSCISDYRYVRVINGTLDGSNDSGVYLMGSTPFKNLTSDLNPGSNQVIEWSVSVDGSKSIVYTYEDIKDLAVNGYITVTAKLKNVSSVNHITAIEPANGSTVIVANDDVYTWWSTYDPSKITSDPYFQKADIYYPKDVTLRWSVENPAQYYRVSVSLNEDMSNSEKYVVNREYLALDSLLVATDYYWRVDAVYENQTLRSTVHHFVTADSPRCIEIEGVSNTRDIGGKLTDSGMRVKQGMVYRGGALGSITDAGKDYMVNVLGIKHDMDLRGSSEAGSVTVSPLGEGVTYHCYNGRNYVTSSGIQTDEGKAIFAEEIRFFANPENFPVYVHCALGRDRTGTAIFVLEALLGVEKKDLYMDYELSFFSKVGCSMEGEHSAYDWINTMKHWIIKVYDYIDTFEGDTFSEKTENYLLSIGITEDEIQSIRNNLLEEVK